MKRETRRYRQTEVEKEGKEEGRIDLMRKERRRRRWRRDEWR